MYKQLYLSILLSCLTVFSQDMALAANLKPVSNEVAAPSLTLKDLQGEIHDLKDYRGQVVLVQFSFVSEVKPEFTILMDEEGKSIEDWRVFAAPSNFIVGPDGNIKYTLFGGVEWDSDELIEKLKALAK